MHGGLNVRRAGWILAILGIGVATTLLLTAAWLSRNNDTTFTKMVGWANIASMTVGTIGVILILIERVGAFTDLSASRINEIADEVALEAMRQDGLLLAQLLGTDALDSRAARGSFRVERAHSKQKSKGRRSPLDIREFSEIVDFYLNDTSGRMVILGAPGTGKTVLAVSLTVGLLQQRLAEPVRWAQDKLIPCICNLPSWEPNREDLMDWLQSQISDRFRLSRKIAGRLVRDGWILPVLDGLDEMDSQATTARRSIDAVSQVNDYIAKTPGSQIVLVCRSGNNYYNRLARGVRNAEEITVQSLRAPQIVDYIKTQCESNIDKWQPVFDRLVGRNSQLVISQLNTPWRLAAAVTFSLFGGDPATLLPTSLEMASPSRDAEYSNRVSKILMETFLAGRIRIYRKRGMRPVRTMEQLRLIATLLADLESSGMGGNEIVLHKWWKAFSDRRAIRVQGTTAWLLLHLPIAALLLFWWLAYSSGHPKGAFTVVAVLMNYLTISFYCISIRIPKAKDPTVLQIGSLLSSPRLGITTAMLIVSGLLGWMASFAGGALYGALSGLCFATLAVLVFASTGLDPARATRPIGTLNNDRNLALLIGVVIGAYAILYYDGLYGLAAAFALAFVCLLGSLLSSAYMRYLAAAYLGGREGLPLRFYGFLNWCHSAGIMRTSGIGYQFRHQELADYLRSE